VTRDELVYVSDADLTSCLDVDADAYVKLKGTVTRSANFGCGRRFSFLKGILL